MPETTRDNRDLVLAPGTYAYILDKSKGHVNVIVGPHKTSLSETDAPVVWSQENRTFVRVGSLDSAVQSFVNAAEGYYVVLTNPAQSADQKSPKEGGSDGMTKLNWGRKINIPGPANFPLWPGQTADVIEGHHLRSNQYLLVRIYNDEEAKQNWTKAIIKKQKPVVPPTIPPQKTDDDVSRGPGAENQGTSTSNPSDIEKPIELVMGQLLVVNGTEVAFYIPPTGVEVIPEKGGSYVRDAVTLERLEYCILLDENGNKRYVKGPAVVFPSPTEKFVTHGDSRKFRAIELNEISGLYIKVIADYTEEGASYKAGDELFVTGKRQAIYYPRAEHAIIKYDDQEVHHAVAIPEGESRYVLERLKGVVKLVKGPTMLLADPRSEVIVKRIIDPKTVELWYPGNKRAIEYNERLLELAAQEGSEYVSERITQVAALQTRARRLTEERFAGEEISRKTTYTPPRTVTLDSKYDGAVSIDVWTGYAVLVVSKTGERRVVVGPQTVYLEYDESLQILELSTGKPKTTDRLERTVYLRVLHNQVSDIVRVITKDLVDLDIKLSYRVDFGGDDSQKWFSVENYVKFLCDHLRSMLRNAVKQKGIEEFNNNAINIIRDTVLGVAQEGEKRKGRLFEENNMLVYDVEVLDVKINDASIASLIQSAQHESVQQAIAIAKKERELNATERSELIVQKMESARAATEVIKHQLKMEDAGRQFERDKQSLDNEMEEMKVQFTKNLQTVKNEILTKKTRLEAEKAEQESWDDIEKAELARRKAKADQELAEKEAEIEMEINAVVKKMEALTPNMVEAMKVFGDKLMVSKLAESMAPIALANGVSFVDVAAKLFKGTALESTFERLAMNVAGSGRDQ